MSVIVALSGGKASAWCADWAFRTYPKSEITLYFNDTKWEHPDLYRFLSDLSAYFDHPITMDSDGRSPRELFIYHSALANNRMPFCSTELKAKRLQQYYKHGDILIFGIGPEELHRANRIVGVYQLQAAKSHRYPKLVFPMIKEQISSEDCQQFLINAGIEPPALYRLGFQHNNCSGGCVRAGKKQWKLLLDKLPEVYAQREAVEEEIRVLTGKDIHFFKDETLRNFRERAERGELSRYYDMENEEQLTECIGVCSTMA